MRIIKSLVICTAMMLGHVAAAEQLNVEITTWLGIATGGSFEESATQTDIDIGDTGFGALSLHVASRQGGQYEFYYSRQETELETMGLISSTPMVDLSVEYLQFGGTYGFDRDNFLQPYVVLTVGASRFSPSGPGIEDETFFAATGGGGMRFDVNESLALKFEVRAFLSLVDSDSDFFCQSNFGDGLCAITVTGDSMVQWTANAGLAFRF